MPFPILAFVALAGLEVAKGVAQSQAEQMREEQLTLQNQLTQVQYQQKKLSTYDTMQRVLATQQAEATTKGVSLASPSFNAIQRHTYDIGQKELTNEGLEESVLERNTRLEKASARKTLYAQLFGDAAETAMFAYKYGS